MGMRWGEGLLRGFIWGWRICGEIVSGIATFVFAFFVTGTLFYIN